MRGSLQSPTSLPQGYSVALLVGNSELAVAGAHVALGVGGAAAHSTAESTEFAHQVSEMLSDFTLIKAAR